MTAAFGQKWTGQISMGRLNDREPRHPGLDTIRTTASIQNNVRFSSGHVASSVIWGRNKDMHGNDARIFNAYTAESTVNFLRRNWAGPGLRMSIAIAPC